LRLSRARLLISSSVTLNLTGHKTHNLLLLYTFTLTLTPLLLQPPTTATATHIHTNTHTTPPTLRVKTRDVNMNAPPRIFGGEVIRFLRRSGFNENGGTAIAELYLSTGLLRTGVDALGLEKGGRLEALVLELQRDWAGANGVINRVQTGPNANAGGPIFTARSLEILIYGRGVSDTDSIDGEAMVRAVHQMSVLVVDRARTVFPVRFVNVGNGAKHTHFLVAMLVEAVEALQYENTSIFRNALLSNALKKVDAYTKLDKRPNESEMQFKLRTAQDQLSQSKAMSLTIATRLRNDILKLQVEIQGGLPRHREDEPIRSVAVARRYESDAEFQVRALQENLAELKVDYEKRKNDNIQLKLDLDCEKELLRVSEYKREWEDGLRLKEKFENAEQNNLQLNKLQSKNVQLKKDIYNLEMSHDLLDMELDKSERTVKSLAKKLKDSGRHCVQLMKQTVQLRHKSAK
jgi:hypothetical protein